MAADRYSLGSLGSFISSSDGPPSVDSSFMSTSSSGSIGYEIESEVGREALKEICCSALSRTLDFPDGQLETLLGYDEENSSGDSGGNVARNITASLRYMKRGLSAFYHNHHSQTYTVSQESHEEADGASSSLPFGSAISDAHQVPLLQLITHMNTFVSREGLFRKSGNKARMDLLVKALEAGQFREVILNESYHANDFASVLKQYFSELPEPLLIKRHLNAYLQAAGLSSSKSTLRCLQLLMLLLPPVHRVILQHLLDLLFQVTKFPGNKMDSRNLSLIFAPTLFFASRSESLPPEDLEKLSCLLAYMIEDWEGIFEVPSEVQVVAERYCKKKLRRKQVKTSCTMSAVGELHNGEEEEEEDSSGPALDLYTTSCKRECVENYHDVGKERAMDEVAKLYEIVKNMPDGPQKTHFMKRFESASKAGCTPSSVVKRRHSTISRLKKSLKRNKENATPKISRDQIQLMTPCFKKGSLISEFDNVDYTPVKMEAPSNTVGLKPTATPSVFRPRENIMNTQNIATPGLFKTPKNPGVYQVVRAISTNSSLVTDV